MLKATSRKESTWIERFPMLWSSLIIAIHPCRFATFLCSSQTNAPIWTLDHWYSRRETLWVKLRNWIPTTKYRITQSSISQNMSKSMYICFLEEKHTLVDRTYVYIYIYTVKIFKDYVTRSTSFALLFVVDLKSAELHQVQQNTGTKSNCPRLWSFIQAGNPSWGVSILQQQHKPTLQRHAFRLFKSGHQFWRGSYEVITSKAKYLALTCPKRLLSVFAGILRWCLISSPHNFTPTRQ